MLYRELLARLQQLGVEEVGRITGERDSIAFLGRPKEIIFPYKPQVHPIYLEPGGGDFKVNKEVILAVLRRFEITEERFYEIQIPSSDSGTPIQ